MQQYLIEEYNIVDFVMHLQRKIQEGYTVDTSNAGCPRGMLGHYTVKLNLPSETKVTRRKTTE